MFNLITINLKYSYSFMYPVNVFQTSINNFIVLIQGNWTIPPPRNWFLHQFFLMLEIVWNAKKTWNLKKKNLNIYFFNI